MATLPTFHTSEEIYTYYRVTSSQLDMAHRIVNDRTHQVYYQVESAQNTGDEYVVIFDRVHHCLTCTCKAGQNGIPCWHKRAALAHAAEYRLFQRAVEAVEEAEAILEQAQGIAPLPEDLLNERQAGKRDAQAVARDGMNAYNRKPFQFMR
jgi:hypothetical protein